MNICFVCFGNICRSPTAEIIFYDLLKQAGLSDQVGVTSAGVGVLPWNRGSGIDPGSAAALQRHGYTDLRHSARRFGRSWFDTCDLILASDDETAALVREYARNDEERQRVRLLAGEDIPNPWRGSADDYEAVYQIIDRACRDLFASLEAQMAGAESWAIRRVEPRGWC